jgi:hypothetical protein
MSDEDKNLLVDLDDNKQKQNSPDVKNRSTRNIDATISTLDEPCYEITNDNESIKTTSTSVPGTPADRATN